MDEVLKTTTVCMGTLIWFEVFFFVVGEEQSLDSWEAFDLRASCHRKAYHRGHKCEKVDHFRTCQERGVGASTIQPISS